MSNGYTQVPNALLDILSRAPDLPRKYRILMQLIRQTYGYRRKSTQKLSELVPRVESKTGIKRDHVYGTLKKLKEQQAIEETESGGLRICEDFEKLLPERTGQNSSNGGTSSGGTSNRGIKIVPAEEPAISNNLIKYNTNKENIKENITPPSPPLKVGTPPPRSKADEEEIASWIGDEWDEMERIQAQIRAEEDWIRRGVKRDGNRQSDK